MKLGAKKRKLDLRDIKLGEVQAPVQIPVSYVPDISWLTQNYQGQMPTCGAHAGSHLKAVLEYDPHKLAPRFSPEYLWVRTKNIDDIPLEDGTDMRALFTVLTDNGICGWNLLPDDLTLTLIQYSAIGRVTFQMDVDAEPHEIASYAFSVPANIKQDIYQNKAVLLMIEVNTQDGNWWSNPTPVFDPNQPMSGHFICAYGYDEIYIYIIDSADSNQPFKKMAYAYPIVESGVAVDLPLAVVIAKTQGAIAILQKLVGLWQQILALLQ